MAKTVIGLFDTITQAEQAVNALVTGGFSRDDISLIARDTEDRYKGLRTEDTPTDEVSNTAAGAGAGAMVGGLGGLLVGLGALAIPGIGPVVAAGPLVATLIGAGVGAAAGGMIGALMDVGVTEEAAGYYAEGVRRGGSLVSVRAEDALVERAAGIMERQGAIDVDRRVAEWRQSGWSGYDPSAEPYRRTSDYTTTTSSADRSTLRDFDAYDADFRSDFDRTYASRGYTYDRYEPAYRYGYTLVREDRYRDREWNDIEPDVRRDWESRNQGLWEDVKDAVRYAWDKVRGYPTTPRRVA